MVEHLVGFGAEQFRHGEQFIEHFKKVVNVAFGYTRITTD